MPDQNDLDDSSSPATPEGVSEEFPLPDGGIIAVDITRPRDTPTDNGIHIYYYQTPEDAHSVGTSLPPTKRQWQNLGIQISNWILEHLED